MNHVEKIIIIFVSLAFISGCARPHNQNRLQGGPVKDYESLVNNLRAAGLRVEPAGEASQPFFSAKGRAIKVDQSEIQAFEYPDEAEAQAEAARVSPDGLSVGTSKITWIGPPHFFKKGRLIVLYVGNEAGVIDALKAALGPQFAGG